MTDRREVSVILLMKIVDWNFNNIRRHLDVITVLFCDACSITDDGRNQEHYTPPVWNLQSTEIWK